MKPLCIDLFCGLGGWTEGFLAEGYDVVGFDIERHQYGDQKYPAQLVLQDVLTLHGSQFRNAAVIVASPPCQAYSYRAMPWKRAKALPPPSNELFDACFRIQREASEAAGRRIPMVVENVKGAQPWVGRAAWHFGSFYLWGDVPALMPYTFRRPKFIMDDMKNGQRRDVPGIFENGVIKNTGGSWFGQRDPKPLERNDPRDMRRNEDGEWTQMGRKNGGNNHPGKMLDGLKRPGRTISEGFNNCPKDENGAYVMPDGTKVGGDWFSDPASPSRQSSSRSAARKAASAQIAKIPFPLSSHIARCFHPSPVCVG